jgi:hypothetical protein
MAQRLPIALALVAALLLPLGAPLSGADVEAKGCCCEALGFCHKPAKGEPRARAGCHEGTAEPAALVLTSMSCPGSGDPATPAPSFGGDRLAAIRFQARISLPPETLAGDPVPLALRSGFSEPPTPPPRPLA